MLMFPLFSSFSQYIPFNPSNYTITYSDEFNGALNNEWEPLIGIGIWGNETFSSNSKYLTYGSDNNRNYLELKAYVENDGGTLRNYSAGIIIRTKIWNGTATVPNPDNPFYYGYYEIEARLTKGNQSMDKIGLWPAFWFQHGERNDPVPGKYWYEEVDIFEPGACMVEGDYTAFHYGTLLNDDNPDVFWKGDGWEGIKTNCDMFNWHRWGVEWLPDRLTFYYDGIPVHTCTERVPFHEKPQLFIDLQLNPDSFGCANIRKSAGTFIGSFQVNYFRYYATPNCNSAITETDGNNFNFSGWSNTLSIVRDYCVFKNTSIPSNSHIIVRAHNYVQLKGSFTVPLGAILEIKPTNCK